MVIILLVFVVFFVVVLLSFLLPGWVFVISPKWFPGRINGISIFPFAFVAENKPNLILHEKIHLAQQKELMVWYFWMWYLAEFVCKSIKHKSFYKGYRENVFEREAYDNQNKKHYLSYRAPFHFSTYYE